MGEDMATATVAADIMAGAQAFTDTAARSVILAASSAVAREVALSAASTVERVVVSTAVAVAECTAVAVVDTDNTDSQRIS
jgi:hypothetical protein